MQHTGEVKEVESKVLEIAAKKESIIAQLSELGATQILDGLLTAFTFAKADAQLRIRETVHKDGNVEIHAEEKVVSFVNWVKSAQEIDHPVVPGDFASTIELYKEQWYEFLFQSVKTRIEFLLTDSETQYKLKFAFDAYQSLSGLEAEKTIPEFLEIEVELPLEESDEIAREVIERYAKILWISPEELLDWDPRKLVEKYNQE